jgi:hypothetical protein
MWLRICGAKEPGAGPGVVECMCVYASACVYVRVRVRVFVCMWYVPLFCCQPMKPQRVLLSLQLCMIEISELALGYQQLGRRTA